MHFFKMLGYTIKKKWGFSLIRDYVAMFWLHGLIVGPDHRAASISRVSCIHKHLRQSKRENQACKSLKEA